MTEQDRQHWDRRYRDADVVPSIEPPILLRNHLDLVPTSGTALDVACGRGRDSLWMASLGLNVLGIDVSPAALALARTGAERFGLTDRCRFERHDLDTGLPVPERSADNFDVILCRMFRHPALYPEIERRLAPGGLLVMEMLAGDNGRAGSYSADSYRAEPDELLRAFGHLDVNGTGTTDGHVWLVATKPTISPSS